MKRIVNFGTKGQYMRIWTLLLFVTVLCTCTTSENITIDGVIEVPENRENPDSRTLKLVYKVLKAKEADSTKSPIVYLQGGPGAATLVMEEFWENHPLRNDRDIVLMDQRGTGKSEANCTEIGATIFVVLRDDLLGESQYRTLDTILSNCKENLKQKGVDLAGYTSKENAADFEDLRKVLGYDKWNLWGVSYGSRLGLTIMRDFPESVRSAMLAGILAPEIDYLNNTVQNFENSLFFIFNRCENNIECNNRYPNLKERLLNVLEKLQTAPLRFDLEGELFVLNPQDALLVLFFSLYDRNSIGNIPILIEAMETGETEPLNNALKNIEHLYTFINWSMNYSVMVYEEIPFYDAVAIDQYLKQSELGSGFASYRSEMQLLADWHSFRAANFEDQPVISEIPTLMVSGGLDHVTPSSNAKKALKHLKNGYEVVFPDDGHNLFNPCFFQIAEDFLNNPLQKPNSACSTERNPIEWNILNPIH
ncbi:alpha/beta fold hydrolase [Maribacter sp. HTCC2170]|uniref:alpha/beta fold hydrolase n=1 Tax=Maribacter sp. (strain HTCC2170 / KCCM 42371) TaxID=313603 RepID=UPI00006BD4BE|nr:alpha/beta fold hydrolase [Maribacter sp. HTCC2170]EAR02994.1 hydrolase, alpha/beta hydrolase fold family protein [Maribacter sp. HTCC2170]